MAQERLLGFREEVLAMNPQARVRSPLSPMAVGVGLAVALIALFVLCAIAQLVAGDWPATHAWIGLFTAAPALSLRAWVEGVLWSAVFGGIGGAIFAFAHNAALRRSLKA
jgi:hypothetical protein